MNQRFQRVNADTNDWCYCFKILIGQFRRALEAQNASTSSMRSSLAIKSEKYPNCCIRSSENHARTLHPCLTYLLDDHSSIQLVVASLLLQRLDLRS